MSDNASTSSSASFPLTWSTFFAGSGEATALFGVAEFPIVGVVC